MTRHPSSPSVARRVLALVLRLYPLRFREQFGAELLDLHDRRQTATPSALRRLWNSLATLADTLFNLPLVWRDERQRPQIVDRPGEPMMTQLLHEARQTARVLFTRQRAFTLLCVLTLALRLGATTAIFTVVHGVLLAPLPYGDADRIVRLYETPPEQGRGHFTGPNFIDLRDRLESFEAMAGYDAYRPEGADLTGDGRVERLRTLRVGAGYFEALGVAPLLGRTFERHEEIPADAGLRDPERFFVVTTPAQPVAILSYGFWQRRFGGDPAVLGSRLELDQQALEVVGVMPAGLGGDLGGAPDVWLPLDLAPGGPNLRQNRYLSVVARLAPGVSFAQAQAELERAGAWLRQEFPRANSNLQLYPVPLSDEVVGPSRTLLGLLFAAVAAMLAIACINVANLFLTRGVERRNELAVRAALGAGRRRLFGLSLIEGLSVGVVGGALGLLGAWLAVRWLHTARPAALPRYDALTIHWPVFGFCVAVVLLTVLLFGLWPALGAARVGGRPALVAARSRVGTGSRRDHRVRDLGVSLQVALSLVLLTAGGLLARSFATLHTTDMGFDPESSLTFQLRLPDYAYEDPERRSEFYDSLFARLDGLPDVERSGATSKLPGNGHRNHWGFLIEGRERAEGERSPGAEIRCLAGRPLDALGVQLLAGRTLGDDDRPGSQDVVLVNRALVDRHFGADEVLGAQLRVGGVSRTVVGVVADTRHDPREEAVPKIYLPHPQFAANRNWDLSFVVTREATSAASWSDLRSQVESEIAALDPRLVVYDVRTMAELVAEPIARQRFGAQLMMLFAALSLVLAAVGLFGALAYSLTQRRSEIGVRMALGADRRAVLASVLRHGLRVFSVGTALGLLGVFAMRRWLESLLWQVAPSDPTTLGLALVTLLLVAAIATFEPARRASRMDPATILREG